MHKIAYRSRSQNEYEEQFPPQDNPQPFPCYNPPAEGVGFEFAFPMSIAMIMRAIIDHIPPIFSVASFAEVANNYSGSKTFKISMKLLQRSLRSVADSHLHIQIRNKETLPTFTQVNFKAELDSLLSEIIRLLK